MKERLMVMLPIVLPSLIYNSSDLFTQHSRYKDLISPTTKGTGIAYKNDNSQAISRPNRHQLINLTTRMCPSSFNRGITDMNRKEMRHILWLIYESI